MEMLNITSVSINDLKQVLQEQNVDSTHLRITASIG